MTNYALRQLMRRTRGVFTLQWMLEGFNTIQGDFGAGFAPGRNLLGFKDGTANPDATDAKRMDDIVWVGARARTSPTGPRAARTRRSASSGCSSSSGTAPA